ncbi:MAG: DUF962 domain-containing protein [Nevskia sp.]|nr:DUF962 domain-containing protein [Nevskia sp.]
MNAITRDFVSFQDFYPFYLGEHANRTCRRLHVVGTSLAAVLILAGLATQHWWLLPLAVVLGYGFSWVGHFVFEKNRPATFQHPWWSYRGDLRMLRETLSGKIAF